MSTYSNTKPTQVLILATFITFFLFQINKVNSSDDLTFSFKKFNPNGKDLTFQGSSSVLETGVLRLNKIGSDQPPEIAGRARYTTPLHIWDNTTGRVASFVTTFKFAMETVVTSSRASDGITFFLAPPDSQLARGGGYFGLFKDDKCSSSYQIVAVEFDTVGSEFNSWDPKDPHIGVDVNCLRSIKTEKWTKRYGREVANVEIRYEASTKTLTTSLTYPSDKTSIILSAEVDLKAILPEWVSVGFTGSTAGGHDSTHDVLDWNFASTLDANNINLDLENNGLHIAA